METLTLDSRSFTVLQGYSPELLLLEDQKSKLKYTAKYIQQLDPSRQEAILRELKILKNLQLSHPSIVSLHNCIFTSDSCLVLYEYCSGGIISSKCRIHPLKILHFLCVGLSFLHGKSFIHNCISPYSVFITDNLPKLSGFESVTEEELLMNGSVPIQQSSSFITAFIAPENREEFIPSKQSDIWSLGQLFFYLLTESQFAGSVPEDFPSQYKDIILMTLDPNPAKRASIQALIKKIEERHVTSPRVVQGCGCFPTRRFFSCGSSTPSLVKKIVNSDLLSSENHLKRLIKKVWDTPGKIVKFYTEIMKLSQIEIEETRVKTCLLVFIYLQRAPVSAFSTSPGTLEVLSYIESKTKPSQDKRNEFKYKIAHILGQLIKSKFYLVNSHLMNFNGIFKSLSTNLKKFIQEPQADVVKDLLSYWEMLLTFQEQLIIQAFSQDFIKFIRKILAEEQNHLLELVKTFIQASPELFETMGLNDWHLKLLERAKQAFMIDSLQLNLPEQGGDILISENFKSLSRQSSVRLSKRSLASSNARFTPVKLDDDDIKEIMPLKSQSFQISFGEASDMKDEDGIGYDDHLHKIRERFQVWNIASKELSLIRSIGKGGSCEVWLGLFQKTQVAIKRQNSKYCKNLKEFEREVNFLVNIRHPNLLTFMGICLDDPLSIVTEYCCGGTLFSLLHNHKEVFISWGQKLTILKEISKGMLFLHSRNFIHRDLKSLNVLLNSEVSKPNDAIQIKISDFGLTREIDLDELMTGKIGTSHWMAPEVLSSSKYSARADVYSFSILMYEVITREVPYRGKKQEEIRTQVLLNNLRPDLKLIPPSCPGKLLTLMTLCWKQEAEKRPSFSSILDLLNGVIVS